MISLAPEIAQAREILSRKLCERLLSNGYKTAFYAPSKDVAVSRALELIPDGCSIGIPGSTSVRQLGLIEKFQEKNCVIYQHWDTTLTDNEKNSLLTSENNAEWFVTGSNAMTSDGKLVNIDARGNRVACMCWGLGKILYILSINKVEPNLERAIARARDCATVAIALRFGRTPPCTNTGKCVNCDAENRLCRVVTIIERVPWDREAHVILVGEELGY